MIKYVLKKYISTHALLQNYLDVGWGKGGKRTIFWWKKCKQTCPNARPPSLPWCPLAPPISPPSAQPGAYRLLLLASCPLNSASCPLPPSHGLPHLASCHLPPAFSLPPAPSFCPLPPSSWLLLLSPASSLPCFHQASPTWPHQATAPLQPGGHQS